MVMSFLGLDMPEPVEEKMVKISWDRSPANSRNIRVHIILDFGKTDWSPEKAADKQGYVVRTIRRYFGVKLSRIKQ